MSEQTTADGVSETPLAIIVEPELEQQFSTAKTYYEMSKVSMAQSVAFMVLLGFELKRIKKLIGETRGRPGDEISSNVETYYGTVDRLLGISKTQAWRFEQMADGAKRRLPVLNAELLLTTPLGDLPELKRRELLNAVSKITDGKTAQQCMWDWGIAKLPQGSGATGGDRGGRRKTLPPEEQLERDLKQAREDWAFIENSCFYLYGVRFVLLSDLEVQAQIGALEIALKARRKWVDTPKAMRDARALEQWLQEELKP